jgi:hypothetical protein
VITTCGNDVRGTPEFGVNSTPDSCLRDTHTLKNPR